MKTRADSSQDSRAVIKLRRLSLQTFRHHGQRAQPNLRSIKNRSTYYRCNAKTLVICRLFPGPAECFCGRFENRSQSCLLQVLQSKFEWIDFHCMRQFIHVNFASEVICSRGQSAVRALAQWRAGGMKLNLL